MLAEVSGQVLSVRLDGAVVAVGGLGLFVQATPRTLAGLRPGAAVRLATSLVVREDSLTLFGFAEDDERDVFELLQTVSGVGPRLALAVLAVLDPDDLRRAVAVEDVATLIRVPGVGRKGAQRMLLELGDKLGPPHGPARPGQVPTAGARGQDSTREQVVAALVGLGWPVRQSEEAVDGVLEANGSDEPEAREAAGVLRTALRGLARS